VLTKKANHKHHFPVESVAAMFDRRCASFVSTSYTAHREVLRVHQTALTVDGAIETPAIRIHYAAGVGACGERIFFIDFHR